MPNRSPVKRGKWMVIIWVVCIIMKTSVGIWWSVIRSRIWSYYCMTVVNVNVIITIYIDVFATE